MHKGRVCVCLFFLRVCLFSERGEGREKVKERNISVWLPLPPPPTGDLACNPGMCLDWESNRGPFGSQASTQSTEPHQPGPKAGFLTQLWDTSGKLGQVHGHTDKNPYGFPILSPATNSLHSSHWGSFQFLKLLLSFLPQCFLPVNPSLSSVTLDHLTPSRPSDLS